MKSSQYYQDNPQGERLPEGWNTVTVKNVKFRETKNGDTLIVDLFDSEGRIAVDFLNIDDAGSNARIASLARISNCNWEASATPDDVANLLAANLFNVDVEIVWGKGDKCFVRSYESSKGTKQQATQAIPQPAQGAPRKRNSFL